MHPGTTPSAGAGLREPPPPPPRRLLAAVLWIQLALCFGPAQLTGERVQRPLLFCVTWALPTCRCVLTPASPRTGVFLQSSVAQLRCQAGFSLKGPTKRLLPVAVALAGQVDAGQNQGEDAGTHCRVPQIEDAEIRNKTYRRRDTLTVACHEGFRIRYPDPYNMVSLCRDDGTWDNLPLCQGCLRPLASSNGYVNVSDLQTSFPVGTVISYHCFPGFKLEGAESLECLHSLLWSSSPPRCLALEVCPLPPTVSHGDFICHPRPCEHYSHGTVLEFYCDPGYSLTSDYKYITCQYGEWFPSYQVYCIKSEQTWPSPHETLLTTWKIVAFTATSVLLVLLLVILARMFQTKFKTHFPTRGPPRSSSSDPDFVVVDGVPVMLPSYDEAVSGGLGASGPGYLAAVGWGCPLPVDDQSPPAYPGAGDTDTGPGTSEPCDSSSGPSELLQSLYPPSGGHGGPRPGSVDTGAGSVGEAASTSPGINIADEIPLMEDDP
ncbi:unnamed protein product [Nyctereutes procyonoides]|uniref:(raccoon dog) hypothetical protein n=1 Tax=Nyctereutes procyonoides TaxID=34880 RepID=A0A811YZD5_NYCPR|nr:unnamed protein product [Nyctereutes procyonoides]